MTEGINISFEFYPPKSEEGIQQLLSAASELHGLSPHFFSMTFGAGGSTRDSTLNMVKALQAQFKTPVAPHLSCIGGTRESLTQLLHDYQTLGISRIVALRGDVPSGMGLTAGDFQYASDLVALIRDVTGSHFHIAVAAYPEAHPQASHLLADIANLKRKQEAGADSAITQYFFNADAYFYFLDECTRQHITLPIIPGIMPIFNFSKLARFSESCGAEIPRWLTKRLQAYGDDAASIRAFGIDLMQRMKEQLIKGGAPGLHFYTLNQAALSLAILK